MAIQKVAAIADYVNSNFSEQIKNSEDPDATKNYYIEYYTTGSGASGMDGMISEYEYYCSLLDSCLNTITQCVTSFTGAKAVPAVLVVGQATGTANAGYSSLVNSGIKSILNCQIMLLEDVLRKLEDVGKALCSTTASADIASYKAKIATAKSTVGGL